MERVFLSFRHWPGCFNVSASLKRILTLVLLACRLGGGAVSAGESAPPLRSGCEVAYLPFCAVDSAGRPEGFSVDLLRASLTAVGRDVTFRTGPWAEVKNWLEQGEVEALPLVGRTPEREAVFDFTVPYLTLHGAIFVRQQTRGIRELADLRGRTVAVMQADIAEEFLRRADRGIVLRTRPTYEQAFRELSEGHHDAVVVQDLVGLRLVAQLKLTNLRIAGPPILEFAQDLCFAVRERDRDTLALLNEGLALVNADGTYRQLRVKWFSAFELPSDRKLIIGGDSNFPPYEFLDAAGRPSGYNTELSWALARELNLSVEIRLGPWAEMVRALERGEIDALQGIFYSPSRDRTFDFTQPHAVNHCVAVTRQGTRPPDSVAALRGRRIVAQDGDIMHSWAVKHGLDKQLTVEPAQEDALREVAEGRRDCALVARTTALYWIEQRGWKNLTVGQTPLLSPEYCYAVADGNRALAAELAEGLKMLDDNGEYRRIYGKWMQVYDPPPVVQPETLKSLAAVAIGLLFLAGMMFLWSWSLRTDVARRTAALRRSEQDKQLILDTTAEMFVLFDLDLRVQWANRAAGASVGSEPEQLAGRTCYEIWHQRDEPCPECPVVKARETGQSQHAEIQTPDGRHWFVRGYPIKDDAGRTVSLVEFALDITNRKRAAEALQAKTAELTTRNEELERFNRVTVGRELRMIELKHELNALAARFGQPPPYPAAVDEFGRSAPPGTSTPGPGPA